MLMTVRMSSSSISQPYTERVANNGDSHWLGERPNSRDSSAGALPPLYHS
jgi:hypothetical protein